MAVNLNMLNLSEVTSVYLDSVAQIPQCLCCWLFFKGISLFLISPNSTFGRSDTNYVSLPKGEKKQDYDFKVSLARLWHGTLQREKKITLHTWSVKKKSLKWITGWDPVWHKSWHWWHSPWATGILGLDKAIAAALSVGTGPSCGSA